ncbi:hypothetical protein ACFORN_15965 [Clostridium disporicum]|nr:hypothetical protein [Clostridium celatum]
MYISEDCIAILKCYNDEVSKIINFGNVSYDYLYNIEEKPDQMYLTFIKYY